MEDTNYYDCLFISEKSHPRKRLKGRKGCRGSGPKGSHKKISRKRFEEEYAKTVTKKRNRNFEHEISEKEVDPNYIDDGGMDYQDFTDIEYSINKKKRWKLAEKLKKEGGFVEDIDGEYSKFDQVEDKMDMVHFEKKNEVKFAPSIAERYHEANKPKNNSVKKKKKLLKEKRRKDRYYFEALRRSYGFNRNWRKIHDRRKGIDVERKKSVHRHGKKSFQELHKAFMMENRMLEMNRKKERYRKKNKYIKTYEDDKRMSIERKGQEKEDEIIDKIRSNPAKYSFKNKDATRKKAFRRTDNSKYAESRDKRKQFKRRNRRKKKNGIQKNILSSLRNKSTMMKMYK